MSKQRECICLGCLHADYTEKKCKLGRKVFGTAVHCTSFMDPPQPPIPVEKSRVEYFGDEQVIYLFHKIAEPKHNNWQKHNKGNNY